MFVIRADGNANIGAGHVMRCLSIAGALSKYTEVRFICADKASARLVGEHGYIAEALDVEAFSIMDGLGVAMRLNPGDTILIDSYAVSDEYIAALGKDIRIILMDDMCNNPLRVDTIINYNAFADEEKYRRLYSGQELPKLILGADYIPIRSEFTEYECHTDCEVTDIFVTTGGGDNDNIAGDIIKALNEHSTPLTNVRYHVICGNYNPNYDSLENMAKAYGNIELYKSVNNMAELMSKCQLGITAGGSTIYEMCAVGLPFVCFAYAANQIGLVHYIRNQEFNMYAGKFLSNIDTNKTKVIQAIADKTIEMAQNIEFRMSSAKKGKLIVDGGGADRIAKAIVAR